MSDDMPELINTKICLGDIFDEIVRYNGYLDGIELGRNLMRLE